MSKLSKRFLLLAVSLLLAGLSSAQTVRIGIQENPDILDPDLGRTYVGRIVFASMCDGLLTLNSHGQVVPDLSTRYRWSNNGRTLTLELRKGVTFQDGEPFNAEAVKYNIHRSLTLPGSNRTTELAAVKDVRVLSPYSVAIDLKGPYSPLLAVLAGRAGMMVAPKAAEKEGAKFGNDPVCAGPFAFESRVTDGAITLKKFPGYWNASAIHFDKVVFEPIPSSTVRLNDLKAGDLDIVSRLAPIDLPTAKADSALKTAEATGLGYQGITINLKGSGLLAKSALVREAFRLTLNRKAINTVVFNGLYTPGWQPYAVGNPWHITQIPEPQANINKAKQLLKQAGYSSVKFTLLIDNQPLVIQLGQVIQAMAKPAGFDISLQSVDFPTLLNMAEKGNFDAVQVGWSGRVDPSGNIDTFQLCQGNLNWSGYCNPKVDKLLKLADTQGSIQDRYNTYEKAEKLFLSPANSGIIYIYHQKYFWAFTSKLTGFKPAVDGIIRLQDVELK